MMSYDELTELREYAEKRLKEEPNKTWETYLHMIELLEEKYDGKFTW